MFLELYIDNVLREKLSINFVGRSFIERDSLIKKQVEGIKESYRLASEKRPWELCLSVSSSMKKAI